MKKKKMQRTSRTQILNHNQVPVIKTLKHVKNINIQGKPSAQEERVKKQPLKWLKRRELNCFKQPLAVGNIIALLRNY